MDDHRLEGRLVLTVADAQGQRTVSLLVVVEGTLLREQGGVDGWEEFRRALRQELERMLSRCER